MSDKVLSYIDIAQEDGVANPSAAFSRVKAKTDGFVVARSPAGVESALGGSLSINAGVLSTAVPTTASNAVVPLPAAAVNIPPGKTAKIIFLIPIIATAAGALAADHGGGLRISNPATANGNVQGSYFTKVQALSTPAASHVVDGDVLDIAPSATPTDLVTLANYNIAANTVYLTYVEAMLTNRSTNTACTVTPLFRSNSSASSAPVGTAGFALVS